MSTKSPKFVDSNKYYLIIYLKTNFKCFPFHRNSVHILKKTDFDAELRTKCIANYWEIPIVIYGRLYEAIQVQIVSVILKCNGNVHYFFIEISYKGLVDIHSRISEIIIAFINEFHHLPNEHLVVKAEGDFFAVGEYFLNGFKYFF